LVLLLSSSSSSDAQSIGCGVHGECINSQFVSYAVEYNELDCVRFCQDTEGCNYYTYHPIDQLCWAFENCAVLSNNTCIACTSGDATCDGGEDLDCNKPGRCDGTLLDSNYLHTDAQDCAYDCADLEGCNYYTFDSSLNLCILTADCPVVDQECADCVYGQKDCVQGGTEVVCGTVYPGPNGTINSPNYPRDYDDSVNCAYVLQAEPGSVVELTITDFAVEACYDVVNVYDGNTNVVNLIEELCMTNQPSGPLTTTGDLMTVRFIADSSGTDRGFFANYRMIPAKK
jgi:hypothetical protein